MTLGKGAREWASWCWMRMNMNIIVESFRRYCEPKRGTGKIEAPTDIWKQYQEKGSSREKLFELYIKTGGEKAWVVVRRVAK